MANQVQTTCENCGKTFMVDETRLKHGRGKNCSMECSYQSRAKKSQKRITRHCTRCGKEFTVTPSRVGYGHGIYCSKECQYPPVVHKCANCGKEFRTTPSADAKFCSKQCADKSTERSQTSKQNAKSAWANPLSRIKLMLGIKKRSESEEWKSAAHFQKGDAHPKYKGNKRESLTKRNRYEYKKWHKTVLRRCNYTCQECGKRGVQLEAHHIKAWAEFPELRFDPSNGIALCEDCHIETHNHYRKPRTKVCHHCGKKFRPSKSAQKFCDRKCFLAWWQS